MTTRIDKQRLKEGQRTAETVVKSARRYQASAPSALRPAKRISGSGGGVSGLCVAMISGRSGWALAHRATFIATTDSGAGLDRLCARFTLLPVGVADPPP